MSSCCRNAPFERALQSVQIGVWDNLLPLHTAYHDTRRDPLFSGKLIHGRMAPIVCRGELLKIVGLNQEATRPRIGFCLILFLFLAIGAFKKHIAFAVKQDVRHFVEEGEPELVVLLVAEAQLDQRQFRREPAGCATHTSFRKLRCEDKRHTGLAADPAHSSP